MQHERIETTLQKAKEMRPLVEKLIHKAKQQNYQGNVFLKSKLFTKDAIAKVKDIATRYEYIIIHWIFIRIELNQQALPE